MVGMSILIADDNAMIRSMLERTIEQIGAFSIDFAGNGSEALRFYRQKHHDLMIIDDAMPQKDGVDVLKELKADPLLGRSHVIMIAVCVDKKLVATIKTEGLKVDDLLVKPLDLNKVKAKVEGVAHKVRLSAKTDGPLLKANSAPAERRGAARYSDPTLYVKTLHGILRAVNWSVSGVCALYKGEERFIEGAVVLAKVVAEGRPPAVDAKFTVVRDDAQTGAVVLKFLGMPITLENYLAKLMPH